MKMKKIITFCLIVLMATLSLSASTLQVGATARYNGNLENISTETMKDINMFSFGPDVRFNVGLLSLQGDALVTAKDSIWSFDTALSVCLRGDFNFLEIFGGVGASYMFYAGEGAPEVNFEDFKDAILQTLFVKLGLGLDLGGLGILADYRLPFALISGIAEDGAGTLLKGKVGVSLVFNLF